MADLPDTIELRIRLSEAETATKFAEYLGEIRGSFAKLDGRLDHLEKSTANVKATVIGTGIALLAVITAIMAYGQAWFGIGVTTRDVVTSAVSEYLQQHPAAKP